MFPVAILAGGLATRLRPLTERIPKAMVEVRGEPFAFHQLRLLRAQGIDRVVFCIGHLGEQLADAVGDGARFGLEVAYSHDGPRLLGTAGALRTALPLLAGEFFVLYGDSFLACDYAQVERRYRSAGKSALMTVFHNEGRWDGSNVEYADDRIIAYSKTRPNPRMRHIDFGLGVLSARALTDRVSLGEPEDLAAIYEALACASDLAAFEAKQRFYEVGSFTGIQEFETYLNGGEHR
jgi:NDP-sugar pyrophosphorylase family protein